MNTGVDLRIVLVSNYLADKQPSMQRFARVLHQELTAQGVAVELLRPQAVVGSESSVNGVRKWLGYVDKFLLYPPRLRREAQRRAMPTLVHICDHSNAMYVPSIRTLPHIVTCHDLLAVRRALGEFPGQRTRWSGRRLQQMIRGGLRQASCIVSDSQATRDDVRRLVSSTHREAVIHPAVSSAFTPMPRAAALERLACLSPETDRQDWRMAMSKAHLLHVGGDQWYKNRTGLIDIYAALVARMPDAPPLVLAGKPLGKELTDRIAARSLGGRVIAFSNVTDEDLAALYSSAALLLFPSLAEGFGWPVAEAMACGCRVVASGRAPMTEVAGDAATYIDPEAPAAAAAIIEAVLREPEAERNTRIARGLTRAAKLSARAMVDAYLAIYQDVLERHQHAA